MSSLLFFDRDEIKIRDIRLFMTYINRKVMRQDISLFINLEINSVSRLLFLFTNISLPPFCLNSFIDNPNVHQRMFLQSTYVIRDVYYISDFLKDEWEICK